MKTNFQMIKELNKQFTPKKHGFLNNEEVWQIKTTLCLGEFTDVLALRNLRDSVVMYFELLQSEEPERSFEISDKVSGIVAVIDDRIFNFGGEV